jgi:hypothetical protein
MRFVGPHLPDPPLPEGEEGERGRKIGFVFSSPLLSPGERRVGEVRADEAHTLDFSTTPAIA